MTFHPKVHTQDYQSFFAAEDMGLSSVACYKKLSCDYSIIPGHEISNEDRKFLCEKVLQKLPTAARIEIVKYLIQLYRTTAPIQRLVLITEIQLKFNNSSVVWQRLYTSRGSPYTPICRGFCFRCGEPESKYNKVTKKKKYLLNAYRLNCMTLCFECCVIGYEIEVIDKIGFLIDKKVYIEPPRIIRTSRLQTNPNAKKLPMYYCAYQIINTS